MGFGLGSIWAPITAPPGCGGRVDEDVVVNQSQVSARVGQLLRLALSTNRDGEALGSLAAIRRTLDAADLTIHDVADAPAAGLAAPPPPAIEGWRALAQSCDQRRDLLSQKEQRFVTVIVTYRNRPSEKQLTWLQSISERIGVQ